MNVNFTPLKRGNAITMLVDTHTHLNFKAFKKDLGEVLKRAEGVGVKKMIVVGCDLKSSKKAVELAQKNDCLSASVGIHPHHARLFNPTNNNATKTHRECAHALSRCGGTKKSLVGSDKPSYDFKKLKKQLLDLAKENKAIALGETGLDYHHYKRSKYGNQKLTNEIKDLQKEFFMLHLELAKQLNLPLIIHCRQAFDKLLEILEEKARVLKRKGVLHCFEGNKSHLEKALNLGFYIGFNGMVTYPEREKLKNLVKITPIEKILLETDSPFLIPEVLRGARNEPKNLKTIAQEIAHLKNISLKEVAQATTNNSCSLFKLF